MNTLEESVHVAIVAGNKNYFGPYAVGLAQAFERIGIQAKVLSKEQSLLDFDAIILVGLHEFSPTQLKRLRRSRAIIGVQTEQLTSPLQGAQRFGSYHIAKIYTLLPCVDAIVEWSRENTQVLSVKHERVLHLPYGLNEAEYHSEDIEVSPRYDIAFIGDIDALDGRRRVILGELGRHFSVHPTHMGVWGRDKFRVFAESQIAINLHVESSAVFESPRFFEAFGARRPLVSEPVHDPWPFRVGHEFLEASVLDFVAVVDHLLGDSARQGQLVEAARRRASEYGLEQVAAGLRTLLIVLLSRS
jgi:hypothetical protein